MPSVALGTSGVSPLEMAAAFATLATGGIRHDPFWIRRVEDSAGRILEERILSGRRTLDASITFQLVDMMRAVLDEGTGSVVRQLGFQLPAAGKTGTTDDFNDAWFTGFTPDAERVGVGRVRPCGRACATPRGAASPAAGRRLRSGRSSCASATEGEPQREFAVPADIRFVQVNPDDGPARAAVGPAGHGGRPAAVPRCSRLSPAFRRPERRPAPAAVQ
ncbi:MAG: penicillin-binding transpeptidase domain-containing protein [Desulfobacterales bacterium]|nr:penicillin-binding transpeptidase domain-containing protein [Desulfobacterales bacterium]